MNRTARLIAGIALGLIISVGAQAKEKNIKQSDLPPAVLQTAQLQSAGEKVTVTGYTQDKVAGEMVYEMNLVVDGRARGVSIGADGTVVSVEQEIAWEQLPASVQTDFTNVAGKGKLGPVSSITKQGKIVTYEAMLETAGKKAHVQVKPNAPAVVIPATDSKN
ncbi:MAG: hypothetical protein WAU32_01345 [Thermoanaerobaculia bacterium]